MVYIIIKAGDRTCDPWLARQVAYPLHQSGSLLKSSLISYPLTISIGQYYMALNDHDKTLFDRSMTKLWEPIVRFFMK